MSSILSIVLINVTEHHKFCDEPAFNSFVFNGAFACGDHTASGKGMIGKQIIGRDVI